MLSGRIAGTYLVTVTDSLGCTDTEQAVIRQPAALAAALAITPASCFAGTNGSVTATVSGGTVPYQYAMDAGAFGPSATLGGLSVGAHTLHIRDAQGCLLDSPLVVLQPARLTATIAVSPVLCFGDSSGAIQVAGAGGTPAFQYAIGSGAFGRPGSFIGLKAGTYALHLRDTAGCLHDTSATIAQPPALQLAPVASAVLCKGGNTGGITVTGAGGTPSYTYAFGSGAFAATSAFGALSAGSYVIRVRDLNGCTRDSLVAVPEPTALQIGYTATPPLCSNASSGSISMSAAGGTAPYQYALNAGAFGSSGSFSGLTAGTYAMHIRDANGCILDSTVLLTLPTAPRVSVAVTPVSCNGGSNGTAQATVTGGTQPFSYAWSGTGSSTAAASGLQAGSYTVTVTDSKGCSATATAVITQPAAMTIGVTGTAPVCRNGSNGSASATVSGGTAPYSYSWSTVPVQTGSVAGNLSSGTYTLSVTDAAGCTGSRTATVPSTPAVTVAVASQAVSCNGRRDGLAYAWASNGTGPFTYSWNASPAQGGDTARGLGAGIYTVTAVSAAGCPGTATVSVTEPAPVSTTASSKGTCPGFRQGSVAVAATGGNGGFSYRWLTQPPQTGATLGTLDSGAYTVIVTDSRGCSDTATVSVALHALPEVRALSTTDTVCRGQAAALRAAGAQSYEWTPAGSLSCSACEAPMASPVADTTYTVVGTDANGCRDTAQLRLSVMQRVPVGAGSKQRICAGSTARLSAWGGIAWQWIPKSLTNGSRDTALEVRPAATTVFKVIIEENRCFTDTLEQLVEVLPTPVVDLGPDLEALVGAVIRLQAEVRYANRIEWEPGAGLSCSDCSTPEFTLRGKTTYVAKVYNELGCAATDTIHITDICDEHYFYLANMFTPNGDGNNDRFYPQGAGSSRVQHFMIYDRWGEIVFSAVDIAVNDPLAGWDGTFRSQQLKPDVYVYVMDAVCESGKKIVVRGDVTLIR